MGARQTAPEATDAPAAAPGSTAPAPTLDAASLAALVEAFQAKLDALHQAAQSSDENFPGATAAFVLPDGSVHAFATGFSEHGDGGDGGGDGEGVAMHQDMRMPSGSIGKTFAAATAIHLAMSGKLDLDQKISTWLGDEDWFSQVPNHAELTFRHLLTHTGGLIDHAFDSEAFAEWAKTRPRDNPDVYLEPRETMRFVLDTEALFAPGEGYNYTDTGYILAGIALEKATGRSYYEQLRELVLDPLGLEFTLPADRRDLPGLAQGYAHESSVFFGTPLEIVGSDGLLAIHPLNEWTGGGLVSNPQDLARFAKLHFEGEALPGDYLPELLAIGFREEGNEGGYGLGVSIGSSELGVHYGHGGFYPGYNSRVAYYPDYGVAVAMQINSDKSRVSEHTQTLAGLVLDAVSSK